MYSLTMTSFEGYQVRQLVTALCLCVVVTIVIVYLKYAFKRKKYSKILPTKQMRFLDPLGHMSDFISVSRVKDVSLNANLLQCLMGHHQLFKHQKFFTVWFSFCPFIVLTTGEAVQAAISRSKNIEKHWIYNWLRLWLGEGLITSHGEKWKPRRKLLTPAFHFDILKDFLPILNEQSQILVKVLKDETQQPWIDIRKPLTLCSLDIICETTLGFSIGAQKNSQLEYVQAVTRATESIIKRKSYLPYYLNWCFALLRTGIQFKKDLEVLHGFTRKVISERKKNILHGDNENMGRKRKILIDILLDKHIHEQTFTDEDIREEVDTFTVAGHHTTSMGMSWALYLIGLHKDVQERVYEEMHSIFGDDKDRPITTDDLKDMEYLHRVLKESQRLYPSIPFILRRLTEDVTIDGYKLPKGFGVNVFIYGVHHNEALFPNPEIFDPDRFLPENSINRHPFAYIPFSAGPRNCIGQRFAMMEEKVVIANVLRNYSVESLDPRDRIILRAELILQPSGPLRVKLKPRLSINEIEM